MEDFPINANPALLVAPAASSSRFLFRAEVAAALGATFRLCGLHDLSVDAAPSAVPTASRLGAFPGRMTDKAFRLRFSFGNLDDRSVDADPAQFSGAISPRFFFGRITLQSSLLRLSLGHYPDSSVIADPALASLASSLGFFLGRITGKVPFPRLRLGDLEHLAVYTDPAKLAAISQRFFLGGITLRAPRFRDRFVYLDELSVHANPAEFSAFSLRFPFVGITPGPFRLGLVFTDLHDFSVHADPAGLPAILKRFFLRCVTDAPLGFHLDLGEEKDLTADASPAPLRRWRWRRAIRTSGRAGERPPPAMRRLRRAGRMISGTAVPGITMAVCVPPPATAFLDPDPLATQVIPIPAVHRRWREKEGVFLSVVGRAFPDDVARIADRFRGAQDLEVAQGQIAERVEIVHLAIHVKKRVLGPVTRRRRSHDHSRRVPALAVDAVGYARCASERSQITKLVTQLRFRASESEEQK